MNAWHPSIAYGRQVQARAPRRCSRNGCSRPAVATLTYVYADSTAVVGPLAAAAEPHTYDLCDRHAETLTAPRGWELVRAEGEFPQPPPVADDLVAIAEAVLEVRPAVGAQWPAPEEPPGRTPARTPAPGRRRGHRRVIPPPAPR